MTCVLMFAVGKEFRVEGFCDVAEGFEFGVGVDGARDEGVVLQLFQRSFDEGCASDEEMRFVDVLRALCFFLVACLQALHARGFSTRKDDEGCQGLCFVFHRKKG